MRVLLTRRATGTGLAVLVSVAILVSPSADASAPAAPVPHVGVSLPTAYDPVASYEAQATCNPQPKPGALKLAALIRRTYGPGQAVSISRGCGIGGTSEHKEGRAVDWMTSVRTPRGKANAEAFLAWLVGPDEAGVPFGRAIRLGVMYVGWNDRYWASYAPDRGWAELKGCLSKPGGANDTICHRNHVHISLSWDGASGRTSLWDGTALTPYCSPAWGPTDVAAPGRAADPVAVTPAVVLSTREGLGLVAGFGLREDPIDPTAEPAVEPGDEPTEQPMDEPTPVPSPEASLVLPPVAIPVPGPACRLHPSGWGEGHGAIRTVVLGQGEVPPTGVAAVAVTVTALGATAPTDIVIEPAEGEASVTVVSVRMNRRATGRAIVPVAGDGTISLANTAGATDLRVTVTGYFLAGVQPNEPVVLKSP